MIFFYYYLYKIDLKLASQKTNRWERIGQSINGVIRHKGHLSRAHYICLLSLLSASVQYTNWCYVLLFAD